MNCKYWNQIQISCSVHHSKSGQNPSKLAQHPILLSFSSRLFWQSLLQQEGGGMNGIRFSENSCLLIPI